MQVVRVVKPYYPARASPLLNARASPPPSSLSAHPLAHRHCSPLEVVALVALCRQALLQRRRCYPRLCLVSTIRGSVVPLPRAPSRAGTLRRSGTFGRARSVRRCDVSAGVQQCSSAGSARVLEVLQRVHRLRASALRLLGAVAGVLAHRPHAQPSDRHCLTLPSPSALSVSCTLIPADTRCYHLLPLTPHAR